MIIFRLNPEGAAAAGPRDVFKAELFPRAAFRFFASIAVLIAAILLIGCRITADERTKTVSDAESAVTSAESYAFTENDFSSFSATDTSGETVSWATSGPATSAAEAPDPPAIISVTVPAEKNRNMCEDIVGRVEDGVIVLPLSAPTDTFSLRRAVVEIRTDAASYSFSCGDGETVDLLSPEGCFCTLFDGDGREYRYAVTLDRSGRGIPVVSVDTENGQAITSCDEYVEATISIDAEGADEWYLPAGFSSLDPTKLSIRGRGNSTWEWPKKPYKLKFAEKTPILGLEPARKWVLLANYADYSLMRNYVAMEASKVLSPETSPLSQYPVDLFLNGEYVGVYSIGEDHNVADGRIAIPKDDGGDLSFLVEVGGYKEEKHVWGKDANGTELFRFYSIEYPGKKELTAERADAVYDYLSRAEKAIVSLDGYGEYIDVVSFADWLISTEFFYNLESCFRRSCFLQKRPGELLKMGPIWDHDLALGNLYNDFGRYDAWASLSVEYEYVGDNVFCYLMRDPDFVTVLRERWNEKKDELLRRSLFCIDNMERSLSVSASYNFEKWQILGTRSVRQQPLAVADYPSFSDSVEYIRSFVKNRWESMNRLIG